MSCAVLFPIVFNTRVGFTLSGGRKHPPYRIYIFHAKRRRISPPPQSFYWVSVPFTLCSFLLYDYKGNRAADDYHADYDKHDYQSNVRAALFYSG